MFRTERVSRLAAFTLPIELVVVFTATLLSLLSLLS